MKPKLSSIDKLLVNTDLALKTLTSRPGEPRRPSPATGISEPQLNQAQRAHIAGLMRINHSGEVCAQALYQGQALTAKQDHVKSAMAEAAHEEEDHLAWCEQRIRDMGSHTSFFNPLWYAMSFTLGATAGAISDKISLGFVAATEDQVCEHLDSHLQQLPDDDIKTRAILTQMREDEARHASKAIAKGGSRFPMPVKKLMSLVAKVMTTASYKI